MTTITKPRIESIDLLKGLVMVIMALDWKIVWGTQDFDSISNASRENVIFV